MWYRMILFRKENMGSINRSTLKESFWPAFLSLSLLPYSSAYRRSVICMTRSYNQRRQPLWWAWVMERWHRVSVFLWLVCSNISVLNLWFPSWSLVFRRVNRIVWALFCQEIPFASWRTMVLVGFARLGVILTGGGIPCLLWRIQLTINGTHAVDGVCWRSAFIATDIVRIPLPLIGRMASTDTAEH